MKDLEKRVRTKFCYKLRKAFTETFQMFQQAYGEDCLSHMQCHEWYQHFRVGGTSIKDNPKSGQPSTSMGHNHVEKVHAVTCENRRLTVCEVSEEAGTCKSSCHTSLTEKLKMHLVATKFVPHLLTDEQKENSVTGSKELSDRSNADENFLKNVVTGDETWVYGYNV
jgi:histone-lysine N-methyltransferase SETMAR